MATNATVKIPFSGSTQGKPIKVVQTATLGTTIHATGTGLYPTVFDAVYMLAYNGHTADVLLTVEFGGATVPDQNLITTVPFKSGLTLLIDGQPLAGNGSAALTISAFAATANVITIWGYVMRTTV